MWYDDVLQDKRDLILKISSKHGIQNVRIFGLAAKLEDGSKNVLDLLVDVEEGRSLFDVIGFKTEIEELLNCKVTAVTEKSIHWSIREEIVNKALPL